MLFTVQREEGATCRRRGLQAARPPQAREEYSSALGCQSRLLPPTPTVVAPSVTPRTATGSVTRRTSTPSLAYDLYSPPLCSSNTHASLLRYAAGSPPPSSAPPEPAGETAAGRPKPRRGGSTHRPHSPGRPKQPAPRSERAPALLARCGVSVSPAGFSPLRWSGK